MISDTMWTRLCAWHVPAEHRPNPPVAHEHHRLEAAIATYREAPHLSLQSTARQSVWPDRQHRLNPDQPSLPEHSVL